LGSDALIYGFRGPAARGEAGMLCGGGTRNANGMREVFSRVGLEKERDDDDTGRLAFGPPFFDVIEPALTNARMKNGFETRSLFGSRENDPGELTAAKAAGGIDDILTKGGADFVKSGLAGLDEFAREVVGVEDREAAASEDGSGSGFPHADAAREANDNHSGEVISNQVRSNK
jgi:hypothetical protein